MSNLHFEKMLRTTLRSHTEDKMDELTRKLEKMEKELDRSIEKIDRKQKKRLKGMDNRRMSPMMQWNERPPRDIEEIQHRHAMLAEQEREVYKSRTVTTTVGVKSESAKKAEEEKPLSVPMINVSSAYVCAAVPDKPNTYIRVGIIIHNLAANIVKTVFTPLSLKENNVRQFKNSIPVIKSDTDWITKFTETAAKRSDRTGIVFTDVETEEVVASEFSDFVDQFKTEEFLGIEVTIGEEAPPMKTTPITEDVAYVASNLNVTTAKTTMTDSTDEPRVVAERPKHSGQQLALKDIKVGMSYIFCNSKREHGRFPLGQEEIDFDKEPEITIFKVIEEPFQNSDGKYQIKINDNPEETWAPKISTIYASDYGLTPYSNGTWNNHHYVIPYHATAPTHEELVEKSRKKQSKPKKKKSRNGGFGQALGRHNVATASCYSNSSVAAGYSARGGGSFGYWDPVHDEFTATDSEVRRLVSQSESTVLGDLADLEAQGVLTKSFLRRVFKAEEDMLDRYPVLDWIFNYIESY